MALLEVDCRRCAARVVVDDAEPLPSHFPFCSDRCRLLDLGRWFDEDYRVVREVQDKDLDTTD